MDPALERMRDALAAKFAEERRVLSFDAYLALVRADPARHLRDATRYLLDCVEHFGTETVRRPTGESTRYLAFDAERTGGRAADSLIGQEAVQEAFHRALVGFARDGRAHRMVLLHGPNGSAKSTFVGCLFRALEAYARTDAGAAYRFSWVFPRERDGKAIGFGGAHEGGRGEESYAYLSEDRIQAKIPCELREHPLLLLPREPRLALLESMRAEAGLEAPLPVRLRDGELGRKNRSIFDALFAAYRGDLVRVLAHVQVERIEFSRRYRVGAVTIGPELGVDAQERAIAVDRSSAMLPASLASTTLYETHGELVDGQRGILEFGDLLERPLDAWKYLLLAVETGEVALRTSTLAIDSVLVASSNDRHLDAFREHPAYPSFRARLLPIRMPYLLDPDDEQRIYDQRIVPRAPARFSPHATFVAAFWAVATRMRPPRREAYADAVLGRAAASLRADEKVDLYASGRAPERLDTDSIAALEANVPAVHAEQANVDRYEGRVGASPREIGDALLEAASATETGVVTPIDVLDRLEALTRRTDLEFLQTKPVDGYHDARALLASARERWLVRVEHDLRVATGWFSSTQNDELFDRYVLHAVHWVKGEKLTNPTTSQPEPPDAELLKRVETMLGVRSPESHRRELLAGIASYAIDHPGEPVRNAVVFPRFVKALGDAFFAERSRKMSALVDDLLVCLDGGTLVDGERARVASETLARLRDDLGYDLVSARVALGALRRKLESRDAGER